MNPSLQLLAFDNEFDPACNLIQRAASGPGYHTKIAKGAPVHPTRETMDYALALFAAGEPWRIERACTILGKIVELQEQDPTSQWFGIWGWFFEEPPQKMGPADWNWADFIGARLAEIIALHAGRVPPQLLAAARAALERAAWAIFRRNVGPGYTNICAMGAAVCLAAGQLLPQPRLSEYGLQRLKNLRKQLEFDGGFSEYNSPTYTIVALVEFERIAALVRDPSAIAEAIALLDATWKLIADQFHPETGQWAGPQCRNYQDWTDETTLAFLEKRLGFDLPRRFGKPADCAADAFSDAHPRPCAESVRERFRSLPSDPLVLRQCWVRNSDGTPAQVSTTWFTADATLGSMNRESAWTQRRTVLGYWRTPEDRAVRLRLRLLNNDQDFASGFVHNDQDANRILTAAHFVTDQGDFHPSLDRPADGTFTTRDLRLRLEAEGLAINLTQLDGDRYAVKAGGHAVAIHCGPMRFDGKLVTHITSGRDGNKVWVDMVFHAGAERAFNPATAGECSAAMAIELLAVGETPSAAPIESLANETARTFSWQSSRPLSVSVPVQATNRPWP